MKLFVADCGPLQVLRHLSSVAGTARGMFLIQIAANSQDYSCSILLALYILCIVSFSVFQNWFAAPASATFPVWQVAARKLR